MGTTELPSWLCTTSSGSSKRQQPLVAGVATGILTYLAVHNLAEAVLAGLPACAGAIKFLDALVD
jgi:hypothetical protein